MQRALLVGINKYPEAPLLGPVNDVMRMAGFLTGKCGWVSKEIRLLTDGRAKKEALMARLKWLVMGAKKGDRLLFHFSGHGVQMPQRNDDGEVDKLDEVICPVDFDWRDEHAIRDNELYEAFRAVPEGVHFTWISDSCHSGDLTKAMPPKEGYYAERGLPYPADIFWRLITAREKGLIPLGMKSVAEKLNLVFLAACKDNETAGEYLFDNKPYGVFTHYFLNSMIEGDGLRKPLKTVVNDVRKIIRKEGFDQTPQIEGIKELWEKPFLALA